MPRYFIRGSLEHPSFRLPEIHAIAELFGFQVRVISEEPEKGILIVDVDSEEHIERLLDRGILVFFACELYAHTQTYEELQVAMRERAAEGVFEPYMDKSWKIAVECVNNHATDRRSLDVINSFGWIGLRGKIDLRKPQCELVVLEDYKHATIHTKEARLERDGKFQDVYFGRRIGFSRARPLINAHEVKHRAFFGNTSMESEMGLLMAGQACPAPGKIMYDPFVGTGSCLYGVAHWGSLVLGSDIDARQFRGKEKGKNIVPGIMRSAKQYGIDQRFLDNMCFDITNGPWRRGGVLDAIITDPPYGVRAGAKRLGKASTRKRNVLRDEPFLMPDGTYAHQNPDYVPPSKPYELVDLTKDLVQLARYLLVPGGRLVFFLPTVTDEYDEVDIPVVEGMKELKWGEGSVQSFGRWGRRLITMVKTAEDDGPRPTFGDHSDLLAEKEPGHHRFAQKYFKSSRGGGEDTPSAGAETPVPQGEVDVDAVAEGVEKVQV
ncbi:hypothetical protein CspeluHIS016_0901410 [Cutaneotrichosporon spelunceum]|uniref:tRNA (guanine(10)-N(2))-methyltransferase n=1 Tax=Cutaneotrichosporon spelunceum TaxID=1672016 RepID=A0AAD3TZV1_9TREE|nr:hypothetical protein CspeluHIS016_0901410 [Cutaneotrichosporon spelunceum]